MTYVYTAIQNGFDNLRAPALDLYNLPGTRFICFTDVSVLPTVAPWEYRPLHPAGPACRTARLPKILPHLMLPEDAEYSIYHDGNFQLNADPQRLVSTLLKDHDWAAHRHPCRNCIYQESEVLINERIGTTALVQAEICRYRMGGFAPGRGLWANGFLVRRHNEKTATLNEAWWQLYAAGCERDQLSFPVAREACGVEVRTVDANIYQSPYLNFYFHAAWKDQPASMEFQPERTRIRERLAKLHEMTGTVSTYPEY